ncbi:hypothetical protein EYF80_009940 [Liparis tanakae]|uniref:Uncharacterized protein n=1 Tax=Liparis tanakae TaxID=230148 RepID=A0A4Z2IRT0_9TELE|nr:hypothetical protein EYF80_009940 [Liparis tanakae]
MENKRREEEVEVAVAVAVEVEEVEDTMRANHIDFELIFRLLDRHKSLLQVDLEITIVSLDVETSFCSLDFPVGRVGFHVKPCPG